MLKVEYDADLSQDWIRRLFVNAMSSKEAIVLTRTVRVMDMPQGFTRDGLERIARDPFNVFVHVIASLDKNGGWAAYVGFPAPNDVKPEFHGDATIMYYARVLSDIEGAMREGDWLARHEAEALFPNVATCSPAGYRELSL